MNSDATVHEVRAGVNYQFDATIRGDHRQSVRGAESRSLNFRGQEHSCARLSVDPVGISRREQSAGRYGWRDR